MYNLTAQAPIFCPALNESDLLAQRYAHLGTSEDFLLRFVPSSTKETAVESNPIACYEANQKGIPTLGVAARTPQLGRETIIYWLTIQFNHTAKQFGAKDDLNPLQLQQAAADFLARHHDLNPYEVMLYLRLVRTGEYGRVAYGKVTLNDILSFVGEFRQNRDSELSIYYKQQQEQAQTKAQERMRTHSVNYQQYQQLKAQAEQGDPQAQALLLAPAP